MPGSSEDQDQALQSGDAPKRLRSIMISLVREHSIRNKYWPARS